MWPVLSGLKLDEIMQFLTNLLKFTILEQDQAIVTSWFKYVLLSKQLIKPTKYDIAFCKKCTTS